MVANRPISRLANVSFRCVVGIIILFFAMNFAGFVGVMLGLPIVLKGLVWVTPVVGFSALVHIAVSKGRVTGWGRAAAATVFSVVVILLSVFPRLMAESVVSEEVMSGTGIAAQVIRKEHWRPEIGDDPVHYEWLVRVRLPDGTVHEGQICRSKGGRSSLKEKRFRSFDLSWEGADHIVFSERGKKLKGVAYVLGNCVEAVRTDIRFGEQKYQVVERESARQLPRTLAMTVQEFGMREDKLGTLSFVELDGQYGGASSKDFINEDRDVIVVLSADFHTHGKVVSFGPVIARSANQANTIATSEWLFFEERLWGGGIFGISAKELFLTRNQYDRLSEEDIKVLEERVGKITKTTTQNPELD